MSFLPRLLPSARAALLLVLSVAVSAYALVLSLIIPVLPEIQRDLGVSQDVVGWVMTACLMPAAIFTPLLGRLGDRFGKQQVILLSLLALSAGSFLAAFSSGIGLMIAGRVLQGVGGGVVPLAFSVIRDELPDKRIPGAVGVLAALFAVSGGLGSVLSGPITTALDYRALFWIPGIVTVGAALGVRVLVPRSSHRETGRISWTGAVLLAGWLIALLVPLAQASTWGWRSTRVIVLLVAAGLLLVAWVAVEMRARNPLIDVRMLRLPAVWPTNLVALLSGMSMYALMAVLPYYVQTPSSAGYGFGVSPTEAGLINLPLTAAMFCAGLATSRLSLRLSARHILLLGTLLSVVGFGILAFAHAQYWSVMLAMAVVGLGFGLAFATMTNIIMTTVPRHQTGAANGMNTNIRTLGGAIGTALVSTIVGSQTLPSGLPAEGGYTLAFAALGITAVGAVIAAILLPRSDRMTSGSGAAEGPRRPQHTNAAPTQAAKSME
ncbi:MFS transporter [Streptomyces cadmiisoli]|uniref:MFS transporter n=1 Tax=Streptomyces cadmiisoli TaxID=2184053 RepID=UPI00366946B0